MTHFPIPARDLLSLGVVIAAIALTAYAFSPPRQPRPADYFQNYPVEYADVLTEDAQDRYREEMDEQDEE